MQQPAVDGPPLIECDLPLGRPGLTAHDTLLLKGWAAAPKGIAGIAVQIGERQWNASYGLDTPWLEGRLSDFPGAGRAGYRLEIDTSGWAPGPHYVTVAAFDVEGGRSAVEGSVDVRPSAIADPPADGASHAVTLTLERPVVVDGACEVVGPLEVMGWAHAPDGIEAVVVTLDGTIQHEALRPVVRPDLLADHGRDVAAEAGFALRFDAVDCPPGVHQVSVVAVGCDGESVGVECAVTCVAAPGGGSAIESPATLSIPERRANGAGLGDEARMWESRALLAEADAALCRAEADLARSAQETTLRALRDLEARFGVAPRRPPAS